jgi:ZIP family zinc transporter
MNSDLVAIMPIVLVSATFTSTSIGGITGFSFRENLHLLLGFSSGAVIAVVLFDMLPQVVALDGGPAHIPLAAVGFLAFFGLERYTAIHRTESKSQRKATQQEFGVLSAGGLCVHSFLDGLAIGVGFQTST